jgi:predicted esterase
VSADAENPPPARGTSVVCSQHGLRFDPATSPGCSRCAASPAATRRRTWIALAGLGVLVAGGVGLAARRARRPSDPAPDATPVDADVASTRLTSGATVVTFAMRGESRPRPAMILADPAGNARGIVARYRAAAHEQGWILGATDATRNGVDGATYDRALVGVVEHLRSRFAVDDDCYLGGFSGGGCAAYALALTRPDLFRGAIVECGHMGPWREVGARAKPDSSFFLFTRKDDFNQPATHKLHRAMYDARCRVKLEERPGGHQPMLPDEIGPALAWLASV